MNISEFDQQVAAARDRVHGMDAIDGFADREPATILAALQAGLRDPSNGAAFDAYVMLQDICEELRTA